MKKIIFVLLFGVFLLSSCVAVENPQQGVHIMDALQVRAWVLDESIEGNVYDQDDSVYVFERLNMNEVRLMKPIPFGDIPGEVFNPFLNIFVEFDGIIEVMAENRDVALRVYNDRSIGPGVPDTVGFTVRFEFEGFFNASVMAYRDIEMGISPVGYWGHSERVGTVRYLTINGYSFENMNTPRVTARLRLVAVRDREEDMNPFTAHHMSRRCFSIELVSYEFPDIYRFIFEIYD